MTREEIIDDLKFTVDMCLFDPDTGESFTEPRNDMDKTTIDACKGAIELLEQEFCGDAISRQDALDCLTATGLKKFDFILDARNKIKNLPSVILQQKTGRWILADEQNEEDVANDNYRFICSACQCSDIHSKRVKVPYCWKCGVNMGVEE